MDPTIFDMWSPGVLSWASRLPSLVVWGTLPSFFCAHLLGASPLHFWFGGLPFSLFVGKKREKKEKKRKKERGEKSRKIKRKKKIKQKKNRRKKQREEKKKNGRAKRKKQEKNKETKKENEEKQVKKKNRRKRRYIIEGRRFCEVQTRP